MINLDSILKSRYITLLTKVHLVKVMVFPVVIWMWELDYKESWVPKNWCFWTVVLEKTLESPLDCKEIQLVHTKGNQSWLFIGMTDAEAETSLFWPPDLKNWLIGKDPDGGKDWRWEKGTTKSDGWMGLPTWWMWVWASFGSWWWTGKPGMLLSMRSQRVGHNWVTELNWSPWGYCICILKVWCNKLLYISSQPYILWHHIASWKLTIVGVFAP